VAHGPGLAIVGASCLLACGDGSSPPVPASPVRPADGHLVDADDRRVLLRGVNVRAAGFFDGFRGRMPMPPFDVDVDCRVIGEDLGMNHVRLAINWSLLEPSRGQLDQAYIDRVLAVAAGCDRHGVYTLVDLHQDGWSKYVGDDGAPFWAHQPPLPAEDIDERHGGQPSTAPAPVSAANGFFTDRDGLVVDYARMAGELAARIDRQPGIIGLELMNEPIGVPEDLDHFHRVVGRAVRDAAPGLPVYVEPNAIRNVLDIAVPGRVDVPGVVYAPHLYTGVFQGNWTVGDNDRIEASVVAMLDEALVNQAPVVVTELGNDPTTAAGVAWLTGAYLALDRHRISASAWVYEEWPSTCGSPSCWGLYDETPVDGGAAFTRALRPQAAISMGRAFPRAIDGQLVSFQFDPDRRVLDVAMSDVPAGGRHVLSAPRLVYTGEVVVTCDGVAVPHARVGGRVEVACAGTALSLRPADPAP
jgi:endoglycosylceramidase